MGKRILRTVLPLMAFLLATAFAIATDQKQTDDGLQTQEYIFRNNICQPVTRGCNNKSLTPCTYMGYQVYAEGSTTLCEVALTHQP